MLTAPNLLQSMFQQESISDEHENNHIAQLHNMTYPTIIHHNHWFENVPIQSPIPETSIKVE